MTRYRVTIRGDKVELRGYVTAPTEQALRAAAEAVTPLGQLIASPAVDDYNPFRGTVTDSMVGAAMNAVLAYYFGQGFDTRAESIDYQALRAGLEAVHSPHLDYYDPARQDRISEHDCTFEDGTWWFGHGMPCAHPELHYGNEPSRLTEEVSRG